MTVKDLIERNAMITDIEITVRQNGSLLLDQLNIGSAEGVRPPYPTRVPRDPKYAGNFNTSNDDMYKDAAYIPKSINAWDDGKDYYEIKVKRIPSKWLDLEVYGWDCSAASRVRPGSIRRVQTNFGGRVLKIVALPSGEKLEAEEKQEAGLPGQMSIEDFLKGDSE